MWDGFAPPKSYPNLVELWFYVSMRGVGNAVRL
jgi:hypothetical protein